jgi:hypothetical protein
VELVDEFIAQGNLYARIVTLSEIAMEAACVLAEDEMAEALGLVSEIAARHLREIGKEVEARQAVKS